MSIYLPHWVYAVAICTGGFIAGYCAMFSPLILSTQSIMYFLCKAIDLSHETVANKIDSMASNMNQKKLDTDPNEIKTMTNEELKVLMQKAVKVLSYQENLSDLCGTLVFFLCSFYVVTITLFSYSGMSLWISNFGMFHIASAINSDCLLLCYIAAFYSLCSFGQELVDSQTKARRALERLLYTHQRKWDQETMDLAYFLMCKYSDDLSLCPYSFFSLNRAGFLSSIALIFTYLIVLLQFRTA